MSLIASTCLCILNANINRINVRILRITKQRASRKRENFHRDDATRPSLPYRANTRSRIENKKWRESASSFMPFNLQIFLPCLLIPMKHVWKVRKVLTPLLRGQARERRTEAGGRNGTRRKACEKFERTKVAEYPSLREVESCAISREEGERKARKGPRVSERKTPRLRASFRQDAVE